MKSTLISRYFSEENLKRWQTDFRFLIAIVNSFRGELEISLRDNYFNLYFRGNNAAKVTFKPANKYRIDIHEKFYPDSLAQDRSFSSHLSGRYLGIETTPDHLHSLLQKSRLDEIYAKIKKENFSEELAFEQMLITDNLNRDELILIDRQVTDLQLKRRMDLLALRQIKGRRYQFLVLEVKMGNNPELKSKVADQVNAYVDHIEKNFAAYKACYEINYSQKKRMGLMIKPEWEAIEIIQGVQGMIVVGGYSVTAKQQMEGLMSSHPDLRVLSFNYKIT